MNNSENNPRHTEIDTGGGSLTQGDVSTGGGNFIGRDLNFHIGSFKVPFWLVAGTAIGIVIIGISVLVNNYLANQRLREVANVLSYTPTPVPTLTAAPTPTKIRVPNITGQILTSTLPLADLNLDLYDKIGKLQSSRTNQKGEFAFYDLDLSPGEYFISFSQEAGVGMIPLIVPGDGKTFRVPRIDLNDLVTISFIYDTSASFALYIDGRCMFWVADHSVYGSDGGDILSDAGNTFFLTPGGHSYTHYKIRVSEKQSIGDIRNPFQTKEKACSGFENLDIIESKNEVFNTNKTIYLKHIRINDFSMQKGNSSEASFVLNMTSFGYKGETLQGTIQFQQLNAQFPRQIYQDIIGPKEFFVGDNINELEEVFLVPLNQIRLPDRFYSIDVKVFSSEGRLLGVYTQKILFFSDLNGESIPYQADIAQCSISWDEISENLLWKYENVRHVEDFSIENRNLWIFDNDKEWLGKLTDGVYVLRNTSNSLLAKRQNLRMSNQTEGVVNLSDNPVSIKARPSTIDNESLSGLIYRLDSDSKYYYAYVLDSQGAAKLFVKNSDEPLHRMLRIVPTNLSTSAMNELGIVGYGSNLYLFVNKVLVGCVTDNSVNGHGTGIIAKGVGDFIFDDLKIYADP